MMWQVRKLLECVFTWYLIRDSSLDDEGLIFSFICSGVNQVQQTRIGLAKTVFIGRWGTSLEWCCLILLWSIQTFCCSSLHSTSFWMTWSLRFFFFYIICTVYVCENIYFNVQCCICMTENCTVSTGLYVKKSSNKVIWMWVTWAVTFFCLIVL